MKTERSEAIIYPSDVYDFLVIFKMPVGQQVSWLVRWGIVACCTILAVLCLYAALQLGEINLFKMLLSTFAVPLWLGVYFTFPSSIATVFNRLWNRDMIGEYRGHASPPITYQDLAKWLSNITRSRWLNVIGGALIILFWFNRCYPYLARGQVAPILKGSLWAAPVAICLGILYTVLAYIAFLSIMRLLFVAVATNWLFSSFTIKITPLHPDGSGGLGALRQLIWISNVMLLAGSCLLIALTARGLDSLFVSFLLLTYLVLFPATLATWLILPHKAMVQAREGHLQGIVHEYNKTLDKETNSLSGPTSTIAEGTERLVTLQKRYNQIKEAFPTWPIEISFASRLGATLLFPLLISIIPSIINVIASSKK